MACGCRRKANGDGSDSASGEARETTLYVPPTGVLPTEQCIACAQKHFDEASTAWLEFGYRQVNRRFVRGNLRSIVLHTYKAWPSIAGLSRECALLVQEYRDAEADVKMEALGKMIDDTFLQENPEIRERMEAASKVDVIIPLGNGSTHDNEELRLMLRSLDAHCPDVGRVFLATQYCPDWIDRNAVTVVDLPDEEKHLKDANLIYKTLKVIELYDVKSFVFSADDGFFMQDVELKHIPLLYNRPREAFEKADTKWRERVKHTFDYFLARGVPLEHEFESHCPQYFADAQGLLKAMEDVDYRTQPGLTIMTAFRAATGEIYGGRPMSEYKQTFEAPIPESQVGFNKLFAGCNDCGFDIIRRKLFEQFPAKSKYEKESV